MKFPFFASFIIFCIWLSYEIRKHRRLQEDCSDAFWEKERKANHTRRKSLDGLNYIVIPFDRLPMDVLKDDPVVQECHDTLHTISEGPVVNLTGISNTDLKLEYGAPNIDLLTLYDQRYTTLARTLQSWAQALYEQSYAPEAEAVLTFAIETRTDISASYRLLARIYQESGRTEKISSLIPVAQSLNSALAPHIAASLEDMLRQP